MSYAAVLAASAQVDPGADMGGLPVRSECL